MKKGMVKKSIRHRTLRLFGITMGILFVLLLLFHFWFKRHIKDVVKYIIEQESKGELKADFEKIVINYNNYRVDIHKIEIRPTDTFSHSSFVNFKSARLAFQVRSIWSILKKSNVAIDSIVCVQPEIKVNIYPKQQDKPFSLHEEIGKVYLSIQKALPVLQVKRLQIKDGAIDMIDKVNSSESIRVSNIQFELDNFRIDSSGIAGQPFLFSEEIDFITTGQDIVWKQGSHRFRFSKFHLNTKANIIEIDSCFVAFSKKDSVSNSFELKFDQLRMVNPDLKELYLSGAIAADTVFYVNPNLKMELHLKERQKTEKENDKSFLQAMQNLASNQRLKYLDVKNANIAVYLEKEGKTNSFISSNNSFRVSNIILQESDEEPLKIGQIDISIRNYKGFSSDSSYGVSIDSVYFSNNKMEMSNIAFTTVPGKENKVKVAMRIPSVSLEKVSWTDLMFNKRLVAGEAKLGRPVIEVVSSGHNAGYKAGSIFEIMKLVRRFVQIDGFWLVDGEVEYRSANGLSIQLEKVNAWIKSNELMRSTNNSNAQNAIRKFSFNKGVVKTSNLEVILEDARFQSRNQSFSAKKINLTDKDHDLLFEAGEVYIKDVKFDSNQLKADGIGWQKALVKLNKDPDKEERKEKKLVLDLKKFDGYNTSIELTMPGRHVSTFINHFQLPYLSNSNGTMVGPGAMMAGRNLVIKGKNSVECLSYLINDGARSDFSGVKVNNYNGNDSLNVFLPLIEFIPDISKIARGDYDIEQVNLVNPEIRMVKRENKLETEIPGKESILPRLNIKNVSISNPLMHINWESKGRKSRFEARPEKGLHTASYIKISDIKTIEDSFVAVGALQLKLENFNFESDSISISSQKSGGVLMQIANSLFTPANGNEKPIWGGLIKGMLANNLLFQQSKVGKNLKITIRSAEIDSISLHSDQLTPGAVIDASPDLIIRKVSGEISTNMNIFGWGNLSYNNQIRRATIDTFYYRPTISKDSFIASSPWETQYIQLNTNVVAIHGIDLPSYFKDSVVALHKIIINEPVLHVYKDKTVPFNPGEVKPLPVGVLKNIPFHFRLDTLAMTNGSVYYTERGAKTKLEGSVFLTRINASLFPLKNYNLAVTDSLRLRAEAYLMNSAWFRLRMRESYLDSLSGFAMTVRMRPADLTIFNSLTLPLASVKIISGQLDTLDMNAVGREYLSLGKMKMHYHNLKIGFLKDGDETKKNFLTGLTTFVANSFVIKTNNKKREGKVFFIRNRHRQVINYWVKMTMSGVATNVGAKHSKKYEKQYRKSLKTLNLPPIDF